MVKKDFGKNWEYRKIDVADEYKKVTLPHDAMLCEKRSEKNPGAHNIGYFEGHDYEYIKTFELNADDLGKERILEFEGIYRDGEVYVNDQLAAKCPYGYTRLYARISRFLTAGKNTIRVVSRNANQPNSRWYTGSGIYRPVWLYESGADHININGIKIRTLSIDSYNVDHTLGDAVISLLVETCGKGQLSYEICDPEGRTVASAEMDQNETNIILNCAQLWDEEHPVLYTAKVYFADDYQEVSFGVRTLRWDRKEGFCINGKRVILKGACIHSDNQLLGAVTDLDAELRRVKLLKENGYNAIRSAHNPCSKYLLTACDKLGMYIMDEYVDMWYIHKTRFDYADHVMNWYERDLFDMVQKDYNHPCVIMYSTGNEVAETGQDRGIEFTRTMTDYLHSIDETRPVSCGVNIFFNLLFSMGFGVYSDEKAEKEADASGKKKTVGSEFYNQLAGKLGDKFMKIGATTHGCDVKTRDAFAGMDIAGYNYGILRYKKDLKKYPDRLILGSETFCKDAFKFYEFAKENSGIVGDFVWAGMDYLGEAGIGSWEYEDYAPKAGNKAGWLSAGSGRLDLIGTPNGEAYYTRVALDMDKGPFIAVSPVYQTGKHSPSAWKMTDALRSWSYSGCDGFEAKIEVYARAHHVELILNGRSLGIKKSKDCVFRFKTKYQSGNLEAVAFDETGREIGRDMLSTAMEGSEVSLIPETETVRAEGLLYVGLRLTDEFGCWKPMEKANIKVNVENGQLIALGNACPYNPDGFLKDTTSTYYGNALAIVRAGNNGTVKLKAVSNGREYSVEVPVIE